MKRLMALFVLVLAVGLGSYAIFAQQQSSGQAPRGVGGGMRRGGGMMGRGMMQGGGMMGGMGCPACAAMMQESIAATNDGGIVVAVGGKLIKYDAAFKKVNEANIDIDWTALHQRMQEMMQNCPMMQQMMKQQETQTSSQGQSTP